ncbi:MAG: nucleoside deaminase [Succinivibrionaceae bacterium]
MNFMNEAIKEAFEGITKQHGGPFGAVIVKDGKIIGRGHNQVISKHDPTAHGEIEAIRDACTNISSHNLTGCTLYTTAEPCPMCLAAILWANISTVKYGCTIQDTENIGFRDVKFYEYFNNHNKSLLLINQEHHEECLKLFNTYKNLPKTMY